MLNIKSYIKRGVSNGSTIIGLESGPVPNDCVFQLLNVCGWFINQATTEVTKFYYTSGGNKHYFGCDVPKAASTPVSFSDRIIIPQGYVLGVEFPDAANTEIMHMTMQGLIMPHCDFKEMYLKK